jgi:hypothetical protein
MAKLAQDFAKVVFLRQLLLWSNPCQLYLLNQLRLLLDLLRLHKLYFFFLLLRISVFY